MNFDRQLYEEFKIELVLKKKEEKIMLISQRAVVK
jgi:hypothetical protein